jgi:hypothetical protein
VVSEVG